MDAIDKIMEIRNRLLAKIKDVDEARKLINSKYINLKNYDIQKDPSKMDYNSKVMNKIKDLLTDYSVDEESFMMKALEIKAKRFEKRMDDFFKNNYRKGKSPKLVDDDIEFVEIVYETACLVFNPMFDRLLSIYKSERRFYSNMLEKLSKIQSIIEKPSDEADINKLLDLFAEIDLNKIKIRNDSKERLCKQCIEIVNEGLERNKKKKELEEKEKETLIEPEPIDEVVEEIEMTEDELLKSKLKNFGSIKEAFEKNSFLFPKAIYERDIEEGYDFSDLVSLTSFKYPDFDDEQYIDTIISLFALNNLEIDDLKEDDPRRMTLYYEKSRISYFIEQFSRQYEFYIKINEMIELKQRAWSELQLSKDEYDILAGFDKIIASIIENNNSLTDDVDYKLLDMKTFIHELRKSSIVSSITEDGKLPIKSFIFFDYGLDKNTGERKAYITSDLDPESTRSLIDNSINAAKLQSNGYDDFCDLVDDLILHAKPRILLDNSFNRVDKIIRPLFYTKNSHSSVNDSMKNASDMVRIRPTLTSYSRFVDERIELDCNSKKFKQVKELLESKIPSITVADDKPFSLFINYLDTFKRIKKENYNAAFGRRKDSKIKEVLRNESDEFTDEELGYLSEMIDFSMKTYSDLEKMNPAFDFSTIRTIKSRIID